jgi:hypothetical protein
MSQTMVVTTSFKFESEGANFEGILIDVETL